jgi:hypothetical protein
MIKRYRRSIRAYAVTIAVLVWCHGARAQDARRAGEPGAVSSSDDAAEGRNEHRTRIGVIGGMSFPRPLAVEGMVVFGDRVALGAEYGVLPAITVNGVQASLWSLAADARVFPFRGAFFVGLRAGHQHVGASTTITVRSIALPEELALDSWFVNPRVGFLWYSREGLAFGVEAGVQFPLIPSVSSTLPLSLVPSADSTANAIGRSVLPTVDFLRIGLLL